MPLSFTCSVSLRELLSLSLDFLLCKMGIEKSLSLSCENKVDKYKMSSALPHSLLHVVQFPVFSIPVSLCVAI